MEQDIQHACYLSASWLRPCPSCLPPWYVRLLLRIILCCRVLRCRAVCCSEASSGQWARAVCVLPTPLVWPYVAAYCRVLQCAVVCCSVLQCRAGFCSEATSGKLAWVVSVLPTPLVCPCAAAYCTVMQCVVVSCSVLQWGKFRPVGSGRVRPAYLPGMSVCCSVLPCVAVCCRVLRVLQSCAGCCSEASSAQLARAVCVLPTPLVRPCVAAYCRVLQCVVVSCGFVLWGKFRRVGSRYPRGVTTCCVWGCEWVRESDREVWVCVDGWMWVWVVGVPQWIIACRCYTEHVCICIRICVYFCVLYGRRHQQRLHRLFGLLFHIGSWCPARLNFWKVGTVVVLYGEFESGLTFENVYQAQLPWWCILSVTSSNVLTTNHLCTTQEFHPFICDIPRSCTCDMSHSYICDMPHSCVHVTWIVHVLSNSTRNPQLF